MCSKVSCTEKIALNGEHLFGVESHLQIREKISVLHRVCKGLSSFLVYFSEISSPQRNDA